MPRASTYGLAVILAVVVGMLLLPAVNDAATNNAGVQTVTNESVTAQTGESVNLRGYDILSGTDTVFGFNDTSGEFEEVDEGTDYELDRGNGRITALESSSIIQDGETMKVSYEYRAADQNTTTVLQYLPTMYGVLILVFVGKGIGRLA